MVFSNDKTNHIIFFDFCKGFGYNQHYDDCKQDESDCQKGIA